MTEPPATQSGETDFGGAVTDAAETTGQGVAGGPGAPEPVRYEVWRATTHKIGRD